MKKLSKNEVEKKLKLLSKNWVLKDNILFAKFKFITFDDAFDFMKIVSEKCKDLNHHPKWTNVYNKLDIELYTHDSGGITEKDFELSSFMDSAFQKFK